MKKQSKNKLIADDLRPIQLNRAPKQPKAKGLKNATTPEDFKKELKKENNGVLSQKFKDKQTLINKLVKKLELLRSENKKVTTAYDYLLKDVRERIDRADKEQEQKILHIVTQKNREILNLNKEMDAVKKKYSDERGSLLEKYDNREAVLVSEKNILVDVCSVLKTGVVRHSDGFFKMDSVQSISIKKDKDGKATGVIVYFKNANVLNLSAHFGFLENVY